MRAIRQYEFGPAENLRYEEVADPRPGPGQVRIAVAAAGVHLIDTQIRQGIAGGPMPLPELPMTPGREVAGVVDQLGNGVDERWRARRVVAHLGAASGGYAELALAKVESLHELPESVTDEAAVAMIGTGRTALGILHHAAIASDDVVLILAAAGGIGSLHVQATRNAGATVIGLAGGAVKVDRVRRLGAHIAVDYTEPDWPEKVRRELGDRAVTVVLDGVGGSAGRQAFELLGFGGRIHLFGWSAGTATQLTTQDLYERFLTASVVLGPRIVDRPGGLRGLETDALSAAAKGELLPLVGEPFPLAEAARAHTALVNRESLGKMVLKP